MLGHQGALNTNHETLSKSEKKKNNLLYKYISFKLGEKVNSPYKYKLTAAISQFFFINSRNSSNIECILYPSMMSKKKTLNFAIDSNSAKNKMELCKLHHVCVKKLSNREESNIKTIKTVRL